MTRAAPNVTPFLEIMMLPFFFFFPKGRSYNKPNVPCRWSKHACVRGICVHRKHTSAGQIYSASLRTGRAEHTESNKALSLLAD